MEGPLQIAAKWRPALQLVTEGRLEEATALLREAAEAGDADAQLLMGLRFFSRAEVSWAESLRWLQSAAAQHHPDALYQLATLEWDDEDLVRSGPIRDPDLLHRAAELGSAGAQRALGVAYSTGEDGFPLDPVIGSDWYRRGAENGSVSCMYDYGLGLWIGEAGIADVPEGLRWLERAALADPAPPEGDLEGEWAADVLADAYEQGLFGLSPDPALARRWRDRHAELEAYWRIHLGRGDLEMALDEIEGPRDLASVRTAAERGDPKALRVVAILHHHGLEGFPHDLEAARAWFRRAADAGDVRSMYELGRLLVFARDREPDPVEGVAWLERAGNAGESGAALDLWQLYENGTWGVAKDAQKAAFWEERCDRR